jgi:hypothetical protein
MRCAATAGATSIPNAKDGDDNIYLDWKRLD